MNSPFSNIYQALIPQITTALAAYIPAGSQVFIDLDYGQLEVKERPAVSFPCVLIDFPNWAFEELSLNAQSAAGNIILKLATDPYSSTSNITPGEYQEAGLNMLEMEWSLYKALEGFKPANLGSMSRTNYNSDNRRPGMKVRILTFTHGFTDFSAKKPPVTIPAPPPNITTSFNFPT